MTIQTILAATSTIDRRDAELLLAHVLRRDRTYLLAHPEATLDAAQQTTFEDLVTRRAHGTPLQYLLGMQEFYGLELRVTPDALIPRPETEQLVEAVLAWSRTRLKPLTMLDIGTGTGAIALALASTSPMIEVLATDISPAALQLARDNALRLQLSSRVRFIESDLFGRIEHGMLFDAIISNPPYIPLGDAATLQREVVDHEPHTALFAGQDGLEIYRRLIPVAWGFLRTEGLLALEFGFGQADALRDLLRGWRNVRILNDYAGIPRIALAEHD
ncbi:MAG: peptide chain release factor N(5)-glutamine methyltransferase [Acidobacteriaceae bacterium]